MCKKAIPHRRAATLVRRDGSRSVPRMSRRLASLLALPLLACTPKDGSDDSSTSDTTADTSAATDDPSTGTSVPTGSDGTATGDEPTGEVCETPSSTVGPPVEIKITNGSDARTYVTVEIECFKRSAFEILGADMTAHKIDLGEFEFTCFEAQLGDCSEQLGCPIAGFVVQLEPGASYSEFWTGGFQVMAAIPEACGFDAFCGGCWIEEQAPAGTYSVRVTSSDQIKDCDGPCEPCTPADDGTCTLAAVRAKDDETLASFEYPAQSSVEVVIP